MDYINTYITQNAGSVTDEDTAYIRGCYTYYLNHGESENTAAQNALQDWEDSEDPCPLEDEDVGGHGGGGGNGPSGGGLGQD